MLFQWLDACNVASPCCYLQAADAVELKKFEETRQRALQQRDIQNKQLEELKAQIIAERAADKKEGQLLKQRAEKVRVGLVCMQQGLGHRSIIMDKYIYGQRRSKSLCWGRRHQVASMEVS